MPLVQARLLTRKTAAAIALGVGILFVAMLLGSSQLALLAADLSPPEDDRHLPGLEQVVEGLLDHRVPADDEMSELVAKTGELLVVSLPHGGSHYPYPYRFFLVKDHAVNAFALPGGDVFVNTGLFRVISTREELAAVLAHEIQHIEHRHGVKALYQAQGRLVVLSFLFGVFADSTATRITSFSLLPNSRDAEREADLDGLQLLLAAGIPGDAMVSALGSLMQAHDGAAPPAWLSDHPATAERVVMIQQAVTKARSAPR